MNYKIQPKSLVYLFKLKKAFINSSTSEQRRSFLVNSIREINLFICNSFNLFMLMFFFTFSYIVIIFLSEDHFVILQHRQYELEV